MLFGLHSDAHWSVTFPVTPTESFLHCRRADVPADSRAHGVTVSTLDSESFEPARL